MTKYLEGYLEKMMRLNEHILDGDVVEKDKFVEHIRKVLPRDESWKCLK